jgi:hypothetical protein
MLRFYCPEVHSWDDLKSRRMALQDRNVFLIFYADKRKTPFPIASGRGFPSFWSGVPSDAGDLCSEKSPNPLERQPNDEQYRSAKAPRVLVAVIVAVIVVIVVAVIATVVTTVVMVPAAVAIAAVPVPSVIVLNVPAIPVPVSCIKLLSIVVGSDPSRPLIRRTCPIPIMPPIVVSCRIPITVNINVPGAGATRYNPDHTGTGGRTNSNAE